MVAPPSIATAGVNNLATAPVPAANDQHAAPGQQPIDLLADTLMDDPGGHLKRSHQDLMSDGERDEDYARYPSLPPSDDEDDLLAIL
jgi:hypothetical protein